MKGGGERFKGGGAPPFPPLGETLVYTCTGRVYNIIHVKLMRDEEGRKKEASMQGHTNNKACRYMYICTAQACSCKPQPAC